MNRLYNHREENINNFANALEDARSESMGISIEDIGKCFRYQFDEAELKSLIKELSAEVKGEMYKCPSYVRGGRVIDCNCGKCF